MIINEINNEDSKDLSLNEGVAHDILGFVIQKLNPNRSSMIPFDEVFEKFNTRKSDWEHLIPVLFDKGLVCKIVKSNNHLALTEKGCRVKSIGWHNYYNEQIEEINFIKEYSILSKKILELEKEKLEYEKEKRETKTKVKNLLESAKTGVDVVNNVIRLIDGLGISNL